MAYILLYFIVLKFHYNLSRVCHCGAITVLFTTIPIHFNSSRTHCNGEARIIQKLYQVFILHFDIILTECSRGYRFNSTTLICTICPLGTYSGGYPAESCTDCPGNQTTAQEGSSTSSHCGKFSSVISNFLETV